jgi:hypothetical protein
MNITNCPAKLKKVHKSTHVRPVLVNALQAINKAFQNVYGCVPSVVTFGIVHSECVHGTYKRMPPRIITKM